MDKKPILQTKVVVEQTPTPPYNSRVKLQSFLDAHLSYTGQETGESYYWARAGSVVSVDERDAPSLLEKRIKTQSCCNGSDNAVFQMVD